MRSLNKSQITVRFYATLREKFEKSEILIYAENVKEALEKLEKELGEKFRNEMYEKEKIKSYYIFLLNGQVLNTKQLDDVKLSSGNVLHIFPPLAGG